MTGFYGTVIKLQAPSKQVVPINITTNTTYPVTYWLQ